MITYLQDPAQIKIGVQIGGDARKLVRDFKNAPAQHRVHMRGLLELSTLAKVVDPERFAGRNLIGLQWLVGAYLSFYLPKGNERLSNWSKPLSLKQQQCSASAALMRSAR